MPLPTKGPSQAVTWHNLSFFQGAARLESRCTCSWDRRRWRGAPSPPSTPTCWPLSRISSSSSRLSPHWKVKNAAFAHFKLVFFFQRVCMIYRWPGFLAIVWFSSTSTTPPPRLSRLMCRRSSLLTGERGKGWGRSQITRRRESMVLH